MSKAMLCELAWRSDTWRINSLMVRRGPKMLEKPNVLEKACLEKRKERQSQVNGQTHGGSWVRYCPRGRYSGRGEHIPSGKDQVIHLSLQLGFQGLALWPGS